MTPDKQAAPSEWVERAMKLSRVCAVKSINKDVRSFYAANEALRAHLESREALVKQLADALERTAQTLAWECFGECRSHSAAPLLTPSQAYELARAALAAYQEKT